MARQKVVNGVYYDLTAEEEAEMAARAEAADLDMNHVRGQRDGQLRGSDWTQLGDAALGDHTAEEWADVPSVPEGRTADVQSCVGGGVAVGSACGGC